MRHPFVAVRLDPVFREQLETWLNGIIQRDLAELSSPEVTERRSDFLRGRISMARQLLKFDENPTIELPELL
jgi:hypothetical protein